MKVEVRNWLCFKCAYCVPDPNEPRVECMRDWSFQDPPEDYFSNCPGYASKIDPSMFDWLKHNVKFGLRRSF